MGVTALSRRKLVFALIPVGLMADESTDRADISEMLGSVVGSLSEENPMAAMHWFAPQMPNRGKLEALLTALVEKFEVSSSISILQFATDQVLIDWFLELKSRGSFEPVQRRRANIKCYVGKIGKVSKRDSGWRITKLEPLSLFE